VKAHLGEASTVDLTARELREYLRCQSQDGKDKWQLWNVENLEAGTGKVRVKRYDHIPDNALEERSFQVVLRRCKTMGET
jgi:hypothetical protein